MSHLGSKWRRCQCRSSPGLLVQKEEGGTEDGEEGVPYGNSPYPQASFADHSYFRIEMVWHGAELRSGSRSYGLDIDKPLYLLVPQFPHLEDRGCGLIGQ